ncbi:DUF1285 domain-containing protein [Erythrobacter sp. EC-HK427]|uniref:DUF1285 domain-containing protein n=1 Tax=Erythrobacter sp. EC-HK427 TaxID=2038396 RepID=UPI00125BCEEB|nr:DUF1285 domain-containing protein [Erythrobacter sp. EC-HK427]VVT19598.1 conserved hypothetical protein [Erythrobacter sp. EC-HK427]
MPYIPPPELAGLTLPEIAQAIAARGLPPVAEWDPPEQGDSGMRIAADGRWFHHDGEITRPAMVRAFASLLRREGDGRYLLVTPHYKQAIAVEDAPFIAVDVKEEAGALAFRLNTDELVLAGPDNPLRAAGDAKAPAIYLLVRHGCEARLNRSTWLQLVELARFEGDVPLVSSQGADFPLVPA